MSFPHFLVAIWALSLVLVTYCYATAPLGYQDAQGFHFGVNGAVSNGGSL